MRRWVKTAIHSPALWLSLSIVLAAAACMVYIKGNIWVAIALLLLSIAAGARVLRNIKILNQRIDYIIHAAMNGDFSYKFSTSGTSKYEQNINRSLNMLVDHIEKLSADAREHESFLSKIINLVDTGIIVANPDGHVLFANKVSLALLSIPVLTHIRQLPDDISRLSVSKTTASLRGETVTIYTINDISQDLQRAEIESLEKLTRVLTHEIMNSLTPINSIAETIGQDEDNGSQTDKEDLKRQIGVIVSSSRSLMTFVKNFRKFSVLPEPKPQVFYLKPFIENIVAMAKRFDNSERVNFSTIIFPPDSMVYTDGDMLNLVLVNLLKNAVEAGCTTVDVECKIRHDESVEISVANNGEKITDAVASEIFTPFYTTKECGSGIGLSLSRRIIARLGGTLTLTTAPHTRFTIVL